VPEGAGGGAAFAGVDIGGEGFDGGDGAGDFGAEFGGGGAGGVAEPVMADHALFIGIGDGAGFELVHGGEGLFHGGCEAREEGVVEGHAGDVQRQAEGGAGTEVFFVALPILGGGQTHGCTSTRRSGLAKLAPPNAARGHAQRPFASLFREPWLCRAAEHGTRGLDGL